MLAPVAVVLVCAEASRFKPRSPLLWSIVGCMGIQWSAVFHLTSLALVGADTWGEQFYPPVNFTVVTAMFDIGRGAWQSEYARPYRHYLSFLEPLMKLQVNVVAFADSLAASVIRGARHGQSLRTRVVEMEVEDLPYFRLRDKFRAIMDSDNYSTGNPLVSSRHPEANVPEYDVLMLSKVHFVMEAMRIDPFNSSYFIWLDGGYGHGQEGVVPEDGEWYPQNLFRHGDKVTVVELGRGWVEEARGHAHRLHTIRGAIIVGGFFGGGREALRRLYRLEREVVKGWMERGVVDDDQSCRMMAYYLDPSLFRLVSGDWWDVFRLFNDSAVY
ncbi:protein HtrL-like [Babylonia areolata]|uniref:protein HtrL-like n=1 Tax=Babylonia areolata TaxID=304850 RepID=UPI003FD3B633